MITKVTGVQLFSIANQSDVINCDLHLKTWGRMRSESCIDHKSICSTMVSKTDSRFFAFSAVVHVYYAHPATRTQRFIEPSSFFCVFFIFVIANIVNQYCLHVVMSWIRSASSAFIIRFWSIYLSISLLRCSAIIPPHGTAVLVVYVSNTELVIENKKPKEKSN